MARDVRAARALHQPASGWRYKVSDTISPYSPLHNTDASELDRFHRHTVTLPVARLQTNSRSPASASWSSVNSSQVHSVDSFSGNGRHRWNDRGWLIVFFRQPFRCRGHHNRAPSGGDPLRVWRELNVNGFSPWFRSLGRNKKSVAINLRQDEGRAYVVAYLVVHAYPHRFPKARETARSQE